MTRTRRVRSQISQRSTLISMFTNALLYAGLLPFVTSALVAVALLRYVSPNTLWATAVAAGFIAAQFGFKAQSGFGETWQSVTDPHEAADWLPLIVLLSLGVTLLFNHERLRRSRATLALVAVFATAVPIRLISGNVRLT